MFDTDISLIESLSSRVVPVAPDDTMAEAGRKILLADFVQLLTREAGCRSGEQIDDIHQMRVATRRLRSALRLLEPYYKGKRIRASSDNLRRLARALGKVRDLDVMMKSLHRSQKSATDPAVAEALQAIIDRLARKRERAHARLVKHLDSREYSDFVADFSVFLSSEGKGVVALDELSPHQVRHVIPTLIHDQLAIVRAYDTVIPAPRGKGGNATAPDGDEPTPGDLPMPDITVLHQLRIEVKRLRYTVAYFHDVLGASGRHYIEDLKRLQDHLGEMNDAVVAREQLLDLVSAGELDEAMIAPYLDQLQADYDRLNDEFPAVWKRFGTRTVQSKLSDALLTLR